MVFRVVKLPAAGEMAYLYQRESGGKIEVFLKIDSTGTFYFGVEAVLVFKAGIGTDWTAVTASFSYIVTGSTLTL